MTDEEIFTLLRSDNPLVVIEAPAGCGKTFQGASYANSVAQVNKSGRVLILTHTHAACSVFSDNTKDVKSKIEIKTIDALVSQIATAYYKTLGLPKDPVTWARQNGNDGFTVLAKNVSRLLDLNSIITSVLVERYPIIICDEYQDSNLEQHNILMSLYNAGAKLRIFGDPMQRIYGTRSDKAIVQDRNRWANLKEEGKFGDLENPHRWSDGSSALGKWILEARNSLLIGNPIDLTTALPKGLVALRVDNVARNPKGYQFNREQRRAIDHFLKGNSEYLILASTNNIVQELRAAFYRRIPIWEGHTRNSLSILVDDISESCGDVNKIAESVVQFISQVTTGFSRSSFGNRFIKEVKNGCEVKTRDKPKCLQELGRYLILNPNHHGVSKLLSSLKLLITKGDFGFNDIKIDYNREFNDAIRLTDYDDPVIGFSDITKKRSYSRPKPPKRCLSTIHKAKGLQCENSIVMACDKKNFSSSNYARCKLYVALSRAKSSLILVVPNDDPSPLLKI